MRISVREALRRHNSIDPIAEIRKAIEQTKDTALALQKKQLFEKGENADGKKLRNKRKNGKYSQKKHSMNPLPGLGIADLKLTGSFHNQMGVHTNQTSLVIDSSDDKSQILKRKYGPIFGHTKESKREYRPTLRAIMIKAYAAKTKMSIK